PEVTAHKVRRSSEPIHQRDALSRAEVETALTAGATVAAEEIDAGADLLITGDMGIGNTTCAAVLIGASLGLQAWEVTGRGTGVSDETLAHKHSVVGTALIRAEHRAEDPVDLLAAVGSADFAAAAAFLATAASRGVPVVLDGIASVACALIAERLAPGAVGWFAAGHRSPAPAQALALEKLGLAPLLDVGMRLGEGSGAMAALPLLQSASALLRQMALLADVVGD